MAVKHIAEGLQTLSDFFDTLDIGNMDLCSDSDHKKKRKRAKDKNAPKKNIHSYVHFAISARPKIKADNPSIDQKEIYRILGEKWKALSDEEKKVIL
ncbi:hypothetical protein CLU79DRAFT_780336 [Phycomyces nitens]|nr:hypothetical protein CLU79DRAFT_780336 [Phycomyces nitens]